MIGPSQPQDLKIKAFNALILADGVGWEYSRHASTASLLRLSTVS